MNLEHDMLVTLIVAIYKSEPFLPKLIESIQGQTYKNIEVILVDDGSPDNSGAICDKYASIDNRICVIHKSNSGACEARNTGLKLATGEYICIIDGDDWLEPDFVEYLLGIIQTTGAEMSLSDKIFTTRDREQTKNDKIEIWTPSKAATAIIYPYMEIGPWNKMYSTKLLRENNITFSVPWSGEGLYFASTAAQCANKVGVGHRKVYNYRLNNPNSGLTHYNVQMGINAKWNIQNIKNHLKIHTTELQNAVNYHIWNNNWFLLFLIVATGSQEQYAAEYNECKHELRKKMIPCLIHSKVGFRGKLSIVKRSIFPVYSAENAVHKQQAALAADKME